MRGDVKVGINHVTFCRPIAGRERTKGDAMRFVLLTYNAPGGREIWAAMTASEQRAEEDEYARLVEAMKKSDAYISANELEAFTAARTVRVRNGARSVMDGPAVQSEEFLTGYLPNGLPRPRSMCRSSRRPPGGLGSGLAITHKDVATQDLTQKLYPALNKASTSGSPSKCENVPSLAISRAAWRNPAQAVRASVPPTLILRTPSEAAVATVMYGALTSRFTGFGDTAATMADTWSSVAILGA